MSGFVVQGSKSDYRDSSGLKNGLYPLLNVSSKLATNQTAMHIPSNKHIFFVKGWSHGLPVT